MSKFQEEYQKAIKNILRDIYQNTEYWDPKCDKDTCIIKPITANDDPKWSNYNFINTHWTVRDSIVEPFVRQNGFKEYIEPNKSYKESQNNRNYFKTLWEKRYELFGPNSNLADEIIETINISRGRGSERENLVGEILNKFPFLDVEIRGAAASVEDFAGTDAIINYKGTDYEAQIKPFNSYQKLDKVFMVNTKLIRRYKQPLLIFGKKSGNEYHILVFWNRRNRIDKDVIYIPKKDLFLAVNYNTETGSLGYKIND